MVGNTEQYIGHCTSPVEKFATDCRRSEIRPFPQKKKKQLCKVKPKKKVCLKGAQQFRTFPRWSASLGNKAPTSRRASHQFAAVVTRSPLVQRREAERNKYVSYTHNTTITRMISQILLAPRALVFPRKEIHQQKGLWNDPLHQNITSSDLPPQLLPTPPQHGQGLGHPKATGFIQL